MEIIDVKIVNKSNNDTPTYATLGSAGVDVKAYITHETNNCILDNNYAYKLKPGQRTMVHTGLYMSIPVGYVIKVHARSGLAYKKGLMITNGVGVIDSDYRGECNLLVYNSSNKDIIIKNGDRIGQFVLQEYSRIQFNKVDKLDETERGTGGFGHTGIR